MHTGGAHRDGRLDASRRDKLNRMVCSPREVDRKGAILERQAPGVTMHAFSSERVEERKAGDRLSAESEICMNSERSKLGYAPAKVPALHKPDYMPSQHLYSYTPSVLVSELCYRTHGE